MATSPVIIAPTYNNAGTVLDVLRRCAALELPIIVVNDGSTDDTADVLSRFGDEYDAVTVLTHERNRGKGIALQTAFAAAAKAGHSHGVTIDTDGQLDPEDIPAMLEAAAANPTALIVGHRNDRAADYPSRSRIGRRLSNLAIRLESGRRIADCQCGLRVYPLRLFEVVTCRMGRFAFEAEIITRAAWAGCDIISVPVACRYFQGEQRVSHFRPWLDSLHGVLLHMLLLMRSLVPLPHRRMIEDDEVLIMPWRKRFWRKLLAWISPAELWRQLRHDEIGRTNQAVGVGIGVFIANLPIYGLQTITSLYVARRLHLHPLPVVAGSHLSTPPMSIVLVAAAISIGHLVLRGSFPTLAEYDLANASFARLAGDVLLEWTVGGIILGVVLGVIFFAISFRAFRWIAVDNEVEPAGS